MAVQNPHRIFISITKNLYPHLKRFCFQRPNWFITHGCSYMLGYGYLLSHQMIFTGFLGGHWIWSRCFKAHHVLYVQLAMLYLCFALNLTKDKQTQHTFKMPILRSGAMFSNKCKWYLTVKKLRFLGLDLHRYQTFRQFKIHVYTCNRQPGTPSYFKGEIAQVKESAH